MTLPLATAAIPGTPDYLSPEFNPESHLTPHETRDWVSQEGYLSRYDGDIGSGLLAHTTPCRRTVERWRDADYLGFGRRLAEAHEAYVDSIESVHTYVIRSIRDMAEPHKANPLWVFGKLNAERPDKYRGNAPQINIDARSVSAELAEIGRKLQASKALPEADTRTSEGVHGLATDAEEV